jgi:hypothetical protein
VGLVCSAVRVAMRSVGGVGAGLEKGIHLICSQALKPHTLGRNKLNTECRNNNFIE